MVPPTRSITNLRPPALIRGIPIADLTMPETLDHIEALVAHGRQTGTVHQVATVNVDFIVNAVADDELIDTLRRSVCLADGVPVKWATGLMGMPLRDRVAGSELVHRLAARSAETGMVVHFFGSSPEIAERAQRVLRLQHPGCRVTAESGPMIRDVGEVGDDVISALAARRADVIGIALGNPKQERFIRAHGERVNAPVMIGIGGSLDMLARDKRRAPGWIQRIGLEWVFRAAQEPRRLVPRYAHDIRVFGPLLVDELRRTRSVRHGAGAVVVVTADEVAVTLSNGASRPNPAYAAAAEHLARGVRLSVRVGPDVETVAPDGWAVVHGLIRHARLGGAPVAWESRPVEPLYRHMNLTESMLALDSDRLDGV